MVPEHNHTVYPAFGLVIISRCITSLLVTVVLLILLRVYMVQSSAADSCPAGAKV